MVSHRMLIISPSNCLEHGTLKLLPVVEKAALEIPSIELESSLA